MKNISSGVLIFESDERTYEGSWSLVGEDLYWDVVGQRIQIPSNRDLSAGVKRTTALVSQSLMPEAVRLRACLNCAHFSMSSMARDMGRGQRGVCDLLQIGVEICFSCSAYCRGDTT